MDGWYRHHNVKKMNASVFYRDTPASTLCPNSLYNQSGVIYRWLTSLDQGRGDIHQVIMTSLDQVRGDTHQVIIII